MSKTTVKNWLSKLKVYTVHKPIKRRFRTRRVIVSHIDDQWQADLVDMQKYKQHSKNMNYILTVIDSFSKYGRVIPIKTKTGEEITKLFRKILKHESLQKLQADKGLEFINKDTQSLFRKYAIIWFSTENETEAQVVERFNRTLKIKMFKLFTHMNTKTWIDIIDKLVSNYNNNYHRFIKMTPIEASQKKTESPVYNTLFPENKHKLVKPKF